MRWGEGDDSFIRPVRWLLAMLDDKVLPVQCFGLQASNSTHGHRIHADNPLTLKNSSAMAQIVARQMAMWNQDLAIERIKLHPKAEFKRSRR